MNIIKPVIEVEPYDGVKIMKKIERACRNCYRSEGSITDDSYKKLITNCISRHHESVLEHEKVTVRMTCDIGVYKDLTRHRIASFSIESTRYCNYGKDKFDNEIKFIEPIFYDNSWIEANYEGEAFSDSQIKSKIWYDSMSDIEDMYMNMSKTGSKPDELRMLLPHSTAAQVYMTANIREWRHILRLRCSKMTHPAIQQVLIPLLLKFKQDMPELFEDVEYNTEFPKDKYAELKIMEEV